MKNKKNYPVYLDFIPLILFFLVNKYYGFMNATIVLIFVSVFVFVWVPMFSMIFNDVLTLNYFIWFPHISS